MIDTILWDVDGTLLDFEAAENIGVVECLRKQGGDCTPEQVERYKEINKRYWKALERGEVTKEELYPGRFSDWFDEMGFVGFDAEKMNADYQVALGELPVLQENALEVLAELRNKGYRQYVVTNGSTVAQKGKLAKSRIETYMDDIFISEEMGCPKPKPEFFRLCAERIPAYDAERTVIIGDSLSSDIRGGNNAGIRTIWFDPFDRENDIGVHADARTGSLSDIPAILESL